MTSSALLSGVAGGQLWPHHLFRDALSGGECPLVNMSPLAPPLSLGFLSHGIETLLFAYSVAFVSWAASQGLFPRLENVGAFKTVAVVPTQATCGRAERSTFCHRPAAAESLRFCAQRLCVQDCPHSSSPPAHTSLFSAGLGSCVALDTQDRRPGSPPNSTSLIFGNHKNCSSSPPALRLAASFTLAVWLQPEQEGVM